MSGGTVARCISLGILLSGGVPGGLAQSGVDLLSIPWGTGLETMRDRFGLVPLDSDTVCTRFSSSISSLDGAAAEECILEFRGAAFAGVAVLTHGAANSRNLLAYLTRGFGPGKKEDPRAYQWFSDATHAFFDEDSDGDGYAYWYSRRLLADVTPERTKPRRSPASRGER